MKKLFGIAIVSAFILAGCSQSTQPTTESASASPESTVAPESTPTDESMASPAASPADATAKATKEFTVVGTNYAFDVKEMKVKMGDTVKVTFKNSDGFHDWRVDEFKAFSKQIPAGAEDTITFVADKKGTFEYYCSVGQHRKNGMVGNLIVE